MTCSHQRPQCTPPCGARVTTWFPDLCAMHGHHVMLDVDPEEGELLHKAYRASQLCRHDLKPSECASCLGVPVQVWEDVA